MNVRVVTATGTKLKVFEALEDGNAWAKKIFVALNRPSDFVPTKLYNGTQSISTDLTLKDLRDKGISFFGAVDD